MAQTFEIGSDFDFNASLDPAPAQSNPKAERHVEKQIEKAIMKETAMETKRLTSEEIAQKQKLILKINRYERSKHYGDMLKSLGFCFGKSLQHKSIEDLQEQLLAMKASLNNDPNSNMIGTGILMFTGFAEQITQQPTIKPKMDLQGWSANLKSNQEFEKIVDLLSLEYESLSTLSPETRLLLILATSGITCVATNKHISQLQEIQKQQQSQPQPQPPKHHDEPEHEDHEHESVDMQPHLTLNISDSDSEDLAEHIYSDPEPEPPREPTPPAIKPKLKLKLKSSPSS